jgi:hypothetical protein
MNNPKGNAAPNASGRPRSRTVSLTLSISRLMLPLVQRIVQDIADGTKKLAIWAPELSELDRNRRALNWTDRQRRYRIRELLEAEKDTLREARAELNALGVGCVDETSGLVIFPTEVDKRRAYFSWQLGEDNIRFWHFAGETARRRIPPHWATEEPSATKS